MSSQRRGSASASDRSSPRRGSAPTLGHCLHDLSDDLRMQGPASVKGHNDPLTFAQIDPMAALAPQEHESGREQLCLCLDCREAGKPTQPRPRALLSRSLCSGVARSRWTRASPGTGLQPPVCSPSRPPGNPLALTARQLRTVGIVAALVLLDDNTDSLLHRIPSMPDNKERGVRSCSATTGTARLARGSEMGHRHPSEHQLLGQSPAAVSRSSASRLRRGPASTGDRSSRAEGQPGARAVAAPDGGFAASPQTLATGWRAGAGGTRLARGPTLRAAPRPSTLPPERAGSGPPGGYPCLGAPGYG